MPVKIEVDVVTREDGHRILTGIPMDFLYQFKKNPISAKRDIAALVEAAVHPYFDRKVRLDYAMKRDRLNPFDEITLQFEDWMASDPNQQYFLHFDLSVTRCSTGIALCHSAGYVVRPTSDGKDVKLPYIKVDFLGRVEAPIGEEIDLISLGNLPFMIQDLGFDLALVTYDRWEARQNIQRLKFAGIKSCMLSIERTSHRPILDPTSEKEGLRMEPTHGQYQAAWMVLKDCMYEDRLSVPMHPYFMQDCNDCDWDERKQKVVLTNRPGAKFDMIQALAGAVFTCYCNADTYYAYHEGPIGLTEAKTKVYDDLFSRGERVQEEMESEVNIESIDNIGDSLWHLPDILDE